MRKAVIFLSALVAACNGGSNVQLAAGSRFANNSSEAKWVQLPDSSRVKINAGTTISVSAAYSRGNRAVDLDGEAMFLVQAGDRFVVTTKDLYIQGMARKFTVDAFHSKPGEEVDLLDGVLVVRKVYQSDLDSAQEVLHSGDMVMINRGIDLMEKEKMNAGEIKKAESKF